MSTPAPADNDSSLMKMVQAIAISPDDARAMVTQYQAQVRSKSPNLPAHKVQALVIEKIISRYSKIAGGTGAVTALTGVIPGVGTALAMTGGSAADISACIKLQVDMTMCLAVAINNKLSNEDAKHMSFLIALTGALEQSATAATTTIASKAGVRLLKRHLQGATLTVIKELFKKVGILFARKSVEKAIPFGVGVIIGGTANYALTKYIGSQAVDCLRLYAEERKEEPGVADSAQRENERAFSEAGTQGSM